VANPTKFEAVVKVYSETTKQARQPMGLNPFMGWKIISIPSGISQNLEFC